VKTGPQAQQERRAFIEAAAPIGRDTFITKDGLVTSTGAVDYSVGAVQCDHLIDPRGAVSV
jgi:hypothetical protein